MNCKIVADSSANIFNMKDIAFERVPLAIVFNGVEHIDDASLDVDAMLSELSATKARATSSCPNVAQWLDAFGDAECVFAIAITSGLSGSYNSAMQAREEYLRLHPERKVHVFDSLSAGPELRIIAEKIAELVLEGREFSDIVETVMDYMNRTQLTFCLASLDNLARNGRISPLKAKFAGVLGIRIVGRASNEGTLEANHKARGTDKAFETMLNGMLKRGFMGGKVRIAHTHNEKGAERFAALIREAFPGCDLSIEKNGGLCSFYAEEAGILVGYEV